MLASPIQVELSDVEDVVAFITAQQAQPACNIAYLGTEAAGIRAELEGLDPSWLITARVLRHEGGISGAVIVEWNRDLGRAWIHGPWADGDGDRWLAAADVLLDAALVQLPLDVTRHEICGDLANGRLAGLAAMRGWTPSEPNHILIADPDVVAAWPSDADGESASLRPAGPPDIAAIAAMHDVEFPGTYASATQLVSGQVDGSRVVLVAEDQHGSVNGYVAGEVHDDGEGFIDFVAVDPAGRGVGLGRQLVVAVTRSLLDRSSLDRVALTVQDARLPARRLYEQLGFRPGGSLVAYRSVP